jgi:DNA-binding transcriptional ArsR family regulator
MGLLNLCKGAPISFFMAQFFHPARQDITLAGVLAALADPARLQMVKAMIGQSDCMSCAAAAPCTMAKSTVSNHFRVLREAGVVLSSKRGVEHRNIVRVDDIDARFPGLLQTILKYSADEAPAAV